MCTYSWSHAYDHHGIRGISTCAAEDDVMSFLVIFGGLFDILSHTFLRWIHEHHGRVLSRGVPVDHDVGFHVLKSLLRIDTLVESDKHVGIQSLRRRFRIKLWQHLDDLHRGSSYLKGVLAVQWLPTGRENTRGNLRHEMEKENEYLDDVFL